MRHSWRSELRGRLQGTRHRPPRPAAATTASELPSGAVSQGILQRDVPLAGCCLLAQFTTSTQVGVYKAARLIADVALRPFYMIAPILQAEFARHWYAGDLVNLHRLAKHFTAASFGLATIGLGLLAAFHPWIIAAALGDGYASAAAPLLVMILGSFVLASTMPLHVLPAAVGRGWPNSLGSLAALAVQITGTILFAPGLGAYGAAFAYTGYSFVLVATLVPVAIAILYRTNQLCGLSSF